MHPDKNPNRFTKKPITFTIQQAGKLYIRLMGLLFIAIVSPFIIIHFQLFSVYFSNFSWMLFAEDIFLFIVAIIVGIALHEAIHGLTWALLVKEGFRAISFGIMIKQLTPYCHCKGYLRVKHYIIGAIMPAILLGIIPTILAFVNGKVMLFFLGVYFIVAASGDFLIIYLLKNENPNDYIKDHETKPGGIVYKFKA